MLIEQYKHHDSIVSVQSDLRGKHREHCLCFQKCRYFKPGSQANCEIAQAVYETCVLYNIVTPMWECPKFEAE